MGLILGLGVKVRTGVGCWESSDVCGEIGGRGVWLLGGHCWAGEEGIGNLAYHDVHSVSVCERRYEMVTGEVEFT